MLTEEEAKLLAEDLWAGASRTYTASDRRRTITTAKAITIHREVNENG